MLNKLLKLEIAMLNKIQAFLKNEEGAETLEYVVIGAVVLVAGAAAYDPGISTLLTTGFTAITGAMTDATTTG